MREGGLVICDSKYESPADIRSKRRNFDTYVLLGSFYVLQYLSTNIIGNIQDLLRKM